MTAEPSPVSPRVAVLQEGNRLGYAVPIAMQRAGILDRVFTDWYVRPGSIESAVAKAVGLTKAGAALKLPDRFAAELDASKVLSKPTLALAEWWGRRKHPSDVDRRTWLSDLTGRWVLDHGFGQANGLFGFVRDIFPGLCSTAKSLGLKVITHQAVAPSAIEHAEAARQLSRFAAWSLGKPSVAGGRRLIEIEHSTWETSDVVTCLSDYVREGLLSAGVADEKIAVIPYPVENRPMPDRRGRGGAVTVGFVGEIGLGAGAPYFFEVARRLHCETIKFVMVGRATIDPVVIDQQRHAIEFVGPVPKSAVSAWMDRFDIFLYPGTCEGSAPGAAEAMAAGLPVVTSRNSGTRVRHAVDGFICPYDDPERMAHCLTVLAADPDMRSQMGASGRAHVQGFDLDYFGRRLRELYSGLLR